MQTSYMYETDVLPVSAVMASKQDPYEVLPTAMLVRNVYNRLDAIVFGPLPGSAQQAAVEEEPTLAEQPSFVPQTSFASTLGGYYYGRSYWR